MPRITISAHWREQVARRIGPDYDATELGARIAHAIETGTEEFARFKANLKGAVDPRKVYRFEIAGRGIFFGVFGVTKREIVAITVLPASAEIKRSHKSGGKRLCGFKSGAKVKRRNRD